MPVSVRTGTLPAAVFVGLQDRPFGAPALQLLPDPLFAQRRYLNAAVLRLDACRGAR
jgi:hypothetical protein